MEDLLRQFEDRMALMHANHVAQVNELTTNNATQMAQVVAANNELLQKVNQLEATQATYQPPTPVRVTEYSDIEPNYTSGNDIQLDAFKVIHEFNGDKKVYRSWRTQVSKLMKQIEAHRTTPKYAAALAIVRAKITGPASDILINNNTAHNIDAIIDRLDFSYADQRPLYLIEEEMTSIQQQSKTLQEFYDAINQGLNMVLTKISMTYKEPGEQKPLIAESQRKAIRTFITGINSTLIRTTLYGNMPDSLSKAFAIAQTVHFDNQHLKLENRQTYEQQRYVKRANETRPNYGPNFRSQPQPTPAQQSKLNSAPQAKTTPMEVDASKQFVQPSGWQNEKRQREASFQNNQPQQSYRHFNKQQRVNHVDESDDICSVNGSMDNNCDSESADEQTNAPIEESIFLDE